MKLGDVEVFLLTEGCMRVDGGGMFGLIPRQMWEKKHPPDELNRVLLRVNSLLIRDEGQLVVVDTGLGDKIRDRTRQIMGILGAGRLPDQLRAHGVELSDVDIVLNTHLHFDHAGGNTRIAGGRPVPVFPNATYMAQRGEWESAMHPNERTRASYLPENLQPVLDSGRLHLMDGEARITPHVRTVITPGHTPNHQSVLIESGGKKALYLADVAPFAVHMERLAWIAAYDVEALRAMESKRALQKQAIEEEMLLIFDHDPLVPGGYLRNRAGSYRIEPESALAGGGCE